MLVFWNLILDIELILLEFFKSIRKGDFKLYTQVPKKFASSMFILDYYNYVSCLPVHLDEIANIHKTHPAAYEQLLKGKWKKSKTK